jgi:hypothetical protein
LVLLDPDSPAPVSDNKKMPGPDVAFSVEASPMAIHPIPPFLFDRDEQPAQPRIGKTWETGLIGSGIAKTSMLFAAAAAIVVAVLLVGNPLALFANATASLVGASVPEDSAAESMPILQSIAAAQALLPTASEARADDELAGAVKVADQSQTPDQSQPEVRQPPAAGALFSQFQAWAAEEDARSQVQPVQAIEPVQPVQDARAQVVENARAQIEPTHRREVRSNHIARQDKAGHKAREARSEKNARQVPSGHRIQEARAEHKARPGHHAQVRPEQNAGVPDRSVQKAQTPQPPWWPERLFGWLD